MKLFLLTSIVSPIVDLLANKGRVVAVVVDQVTHAGHRIAHVGASVMPSITG